MSLSFWDLNLQDSKMKLRPGHWIQCLHRVNFIDLRGQQSRDDSQTNQQEVLKLEELQRIQSRMEVKGGDHRRCKGRSN